MKLIVLDRDGVINYDSQNYIRSPAQWRAIESSLTALKLLHQAGFHVVVCTNQSGISRGYYDEKTLADIHAKMFNIVAEHGGKITKVYHCPHLPQDQCQCRKPRPGLLKQISEDFQIDLTQQIMVGDRLCDIKAALSMQMIPIMVRSGILKEYCLSDPLLHEVEIFDDLYAATLSILAAP